MRAGDRGAVAGTVGSGATGAPSRSSGAAAGGGAVPRSKLEQNEHNCDTPAPSVPFSSWLWATCMNEARPTASASAATSRRSRSQPGSRQGEKSMGRWVVACTKSGGPGSRTRAAR